MKNLGSVMAAYMIGWAVFFFYFVSVARRTLQLRKEVQRLKESISVKQSISAPAVGSSTRGK